MKFTLFEKLAELNLYNWILILVAAALAGGLTFLLVKLKREQQGGASSIKRFDGAKPLVYGALMVALSFILSYLKLFYLPQGGAITVGSVLPLALYAYWFGPKYGFIGGLAAGFLQLIQKPEVVHYVQVFLDYFLAFACFGFAGFFRRYSKTGLHVGLLLGGLGRIVCSTISGGVFFGQYAPEGINPWIYSAVYNLTTLGPDILIAAIIAAFPPIRRLFERLHPAP